MNTIRNSFDRLLNSQVGMKRTALVLLTLQNVSVVLLSRYVRSRPGDMFISSTAVAMSELVKFFVCLFLVFIENSWSFWSIASDLKTNLLDCRDNLLIGVPGVLYGVQNNLLIISVSYLNASLFQVSYQLKVFTTAIFFRLILHRVLTLKHWLALLCLFLGVVLAQFQSTSHAAESEMTYQQSLIGLSVVVFACCLSGFAGVFFELVLKSTPKTIVMRNIQLSVYGFLAGIMQVFMLDKQLVLSKGFFYGYDASVWVMIFIQSLGGLLVAAVVRYADNILKNFATSVSLVLTLILSVVIFHTEPSVYLITGNVLVIVATVFYNNLPAPAVSPNKRISEQLLPDQERAMAKNVIPKV